MLIPGEEVRALSYRAVANNGLTADEARTVADVPMEAELRGRKTHGLIRIPAVIQRRSAKQTTPIRTLLENACSGLLDGGDNLGYLVSHRCAQIAMAKARQSGVALVGANNTGHTSKGIELDDA
jgi:LDH2 family malate/lactate/ureidoglycolate dehydrogenase